MQSPTRAIIFTLPITIVDVLISLMPSLQRPLGDRLATEGLFSVMSNQGGLLMRNHFCESICRKQKWKKVWSCPKLSCLSVLQSVILLFILKPLQTFLTKQEISLAITNRTLFSPRIYQYSVSFWFRLRALYVLLLNGHRFPIHCVCIVVRLREWQKLFLQS